MVEYGSRQTLIQIDPDHTQIKLGGLVVVKVVNLTCIWGNTVNEEPTIGTDIPDQWTGKFHGVITLDILYMVDLPLDTLSAPGADGMIPESTITGVLTDTEATPKTDTWTIKARLNQPSMIMREQGFLRARMSGILTARPTKIQT